MSHIFISYSRKDLEFAQKIVTALSDNKLDTWVDWKSIPKGEDWEQEIYRGIEEADAFLFLISPDSVASEMCNKEIAHAVKNGKRILPIVIREVDQKSIHPEISKRNWIFCRDGHDDFNKAIEETRKSIHTDYEWLKFHTELQVKALKWEQKKDVSRLSRGKELREAEQQLAEISGQEDPQPTQLQREYILASQRNEVRTRRQITIGLVVGFGIMVVLAFVAWGQRNVAISETNAKATALVNEEMARNAAIAEANARATAQVEAENQAISARIGELSALAIAKVNSNYSLSLLLGIESFQLQRSDKQNAKSQYALLYLLQGHPKISQVKQGHVDNISSIAYAPNKHLVATGSLDGTIILWNMTDINNLRQLSVIQAHSGFINSLNFDSLGDVLASASSDATFSLWNVSNPVAPVQLSIIDAHQSPVEDVEFSPVGKILASSDLDTNIFFWDVSNPKEPIQKSAIKGLESGIGQVTFSPDGKKLVSGYHLLKDAGDHWESIQPQNIAILWDISNISNPKRISVIPRTTITNSAITSSALFTQDGKTLILDDSYNTYFWDISNPSQPIYITTLINAKYPTLNANQLYLATAYNGTITVWDISSLQGIEKKVELTGINKVGHMVFSSDGKSLFSGGNPDLAIWAPFDDIEPLQFGVITDTHGTVNSISISPGRKLLAFAGMSNTFDIWDISNPRLPSKVDLLTGHVSNVDVVSFSPNGEILASGDYGGMVKLWKVLDNQTHEFLSDLKIHGDIISDLKFSSDGKRLAAASYDGSISIWDISNPSNPLLQQVLQGNLGRIQSLSFNNDSTLLAAGSWDNSVFVWQLETDRYQNIAKLNGHVNILEAVTFRPGGQELISAGRDNRVIIWKENKSNAYIERDVLLDHTNWVNTMLFSPDGMTLFSGDEDGKIFLWTFANPIQPLNSGILIEKNIRSMSISSDGQILATGNAQGYITLWNLNSNYWVTTACNIAGRNFTLAEWQQNFPGEEYRLTCPQWPAGE